MLLVNESINVTIPSYKQESSNVQYVIEIKTRNKQQWLITKRYSQFEDLHKKLILLFQDLPELPKKAFITFLVGKSKEQLEDRRFGLEKYIQQLIVRREIYHSQQLRDFLEVQQFIISLNNVKKLFLLIQSILLKHQWVYVMFHCLIKE